MKHIFGIILNIVNVFIKFIIFMLSLFLQAYVIWLSIYSVPHLYPVYITTQLISLIPIVHIYNSSNNSSFKMSWIILILCVPVSGIIMYLFFGQGRNFSKKRAKKINQYVEPYLQRKSNLELIENTMDKKMACLLHSTSLLPFYHDSNVEFIPDGAIWFEKMIEDIKQAKKYIFLEYFIINDGEALNRLSSVLIKKALEGVEIKIILDDIGSKRGLKQKTIDHLNSYDHITVCSFNPMGMFFSLNLNFRNHRKITIVDGNIAYCGGANIADEYIHKKVRFGFWKDNACKYFGPAVDSFVYLFCTDWFVSTKQELNMNDYFAQFKVSNLSQNFICPFGDGPGEDDNPGYTLIKSLIENAKHSIYISTPYFIIDREFICALENAAKSGVDVRILIPNIPDKKAIYALTYYHIGRLIKSGVKVYKFTPGFNHAKNIIVDDAYTFNGTINLDYRSLFLHFECGAFHINKTLNKEMKKDFLTSLEQSQLIDYSDWKKRSLLTRIIEFIGSLFAPLL